MTCQWSCELHMWITFWSLKMWIKRIRDISMNHQTPHANEPFNFDMPRKVWTLTSPGKCELWQAKMKKKKIIIYKQYYGVHLYQQFHQPSLVATLLSLVAIFNIFIATISSLIVTSNSLVATFSSWASDISSITLHRKTSAVKNSPKHISNNVTRVHVWL